MRVQRNINVILVLFRIFGIEIFQFQLFLGLEKFVQFVSVIGKFIYYLADLALVHQPLLNLLHSERPESGVLLHALR